MSTTKIQNRACDTGRKVSPRCFDVWNIGTTINTRIEDSRAKTPPSLLGIDRKMAYANRKYHSGLMWGGVTIGFAGVKLSGSPSRFGLNRASIIRAGTKMEKPRTSL